MGNVLCGLASAALAGLRAVAITEWPARRAASAIAAPRPEDAPVISQVLDVILNM